MKIDACMSATLRGRYARLCVKLPLDQPVAKFILIGDHKQLIEYERNNFLCKSCEKLGHIMSQCPTPANAISDMPNKRRIEFDQQEDQQTHTLNDEEGWQTVTFPKTKKSQGRKPIEGKEATSEAGINVCLLAKVVGPIL